MSRQSWSNVVGILDKMPTGDPLFENGKSLYYSIFGSPPPPPTKAGILGLLSMNGHRHCVRDGEEEMEETPYVGKSARCPNF